MNRKRLLNAELSHAIACMGHGDLMIICDAGFPIPWTAWRIDLAIVPNVPDLETVLLPISQNLIAERVGYADVLPQHNAPLLAKIKRLFPDADFEPAKHEVLLSEMAAKAKAIVRTGAFDPWGNILLYSGVDVPAWFSKPGVVAPDYLREKVEGLMPRIFDFAGREVERCETVAGLRALKGSGRRVTQTTADTAEEAAAADEAGVEMVVCRSANVRQVREGSQRLFVTAALGFTQAVTADDMLRTAFAAIAAGADAVITARGYEMVRLLSAELIPMVGHLGFVPRKSTWFGAVRAVGKTAAEAIGPVGPLSPPRRRRRVRRRMRVDPRRRPVGDQPSHLPCHDLARIGRGRRRDFPLRLRHLRRVVEAASPCASMGRPRTAAQGHAGREGQGALRLPRRGGVRQLSRLLSRSPRFQVVSWRILAPGLGAVQKPRGPCGMRR